MDNKINGKKTISTNSGLIVKSSYFTAALFGLEYRVHISFNYCEVGPRYFEEGWRDGINAIVYQQIVDLIDTHCDRPELTGLNSTTFRYSFIGITPETLINKLPLVERQSDINIKVVEAFQGDLWIYWRPDIGLYRSKTRRHIWGNNRDFI